MGEVYRARDTRLDREARAISLLDHVLPDDEILRVDNAGVAGGTRELKVILSFFTELRQKAPAR